MLLDKKKALYVKACVIANGVEDRQGDTLYKDDIKKIFTSFNNQNNFEVYHNELPIQEVSLLENYISTADETIGTSIVPSGSWNVVIRVDNPDIQESLLIGEFGGISLNNRINPKCSEGLSGQVRYKDIPDAECVIPLLISFVEKGANGYGLHVLDYDAYIQKSDDSKNKKGAKNMAFNLLDGLKSLIKEAEASEKKDEPVILEEDKKETINEEETTEPEEIKKEDNTTEDKKEEDETVEKEDPTVALEERITALENRISELESKIEQNTDEEETDETTDDTPKITKSAASSKVIDTSNDESTTNNNYFEITGRDPLTGLPKKE